MSLIRVVDGFVEVTFFDKQSAKVQERGRFQKSIVFPLSEREALKEVLACLGELILSEGKKTSGLESLATTFGLAVGTEPIGFLKFLLCPFEIVLSCQSNCLKCKYRNVEIFWSSL